jgi:stage V sporulation protein R
MDPQVAQLSEDIEQMWAMAKEFGLDPYPIHFEMVPASIMYEFGAYGLPGRYSHWTHGKAFYRMKTQYDYGLSKIYEMVINADPAYAFLLENNSLTQNRLVVAHVLGHVDFFKRNAYFRFTNRQMVETASLNAGRIRDYEYTHGTRKVEEFLDAVLSIAEHIDPHLSFRYLTDAEKRIERDRPSKPVESAYDDIWNLRGVDDAPDSPLPSRDSGLASLNRLKERGKSDERDASTRFPEEPEKDLLRFILDYARGLEDWQRDIIGIVRQEMLYFVPQMQTKIMNEGWASFWHQRIMREFEMTSDEYTEYATVNAGVVAPSRYHVNPYYLGVKMYEAIEKRWDNPTDEERKRLDREPGQGRAKLFEVRELDNDISFLRNYLTKELIEELDLYLYAKEGNEWVIVEKNWEKVRDSIVTSMTNFGVPYITVEDGDYRRNHELYLLHRHEDQELDLGYAEKTIQYLYQLWGRPVHLETVVGEERVLISYDGSRTTRSAIGVHKPSK